MGPPSRFNNGYNAVPAGPPPPPNYYSGYGAPPIGPPPSYRDNYNPRYGGPPPGPPRMQQSHGWGGGPPPGPPHTQYENSFGSRDAHFSRPPTSAQSFGVQGYNFQYSSCTGRRKALLIGINYYGQKNQLRGCINDVINVQDFLKQHGYKGEDTVVLRDDSRDQRVIPTRENIVRAMKWLVKGAQTNDSLFLHYSGHGGQTEDLDGDEDSGYDDVIYPVDYVRAGHIVDDDIHLMLVKPLMPGVRLTALFDCCHSGTAMDLPYVYSTRGILKEPNLMREAGSGLLSAVSSYAKGDISGVVSAVSGVIKRAKNGNSGYEKSLRTKTSPSDCIMFSGCKDTETSADAVVNGQATGAMSHAFIAVMRSNPNQSYLTLLNNMRAALDGKYNQKPQLSASHPIDCNLQFIF